MVPKDDNNSITSKQYFSSVHNPHDKVLFLKPRVIWFRWWWSKFWCRIIRKYCLLKYLNFKSCSIPLQNVHSHTIYNKYHYIILTCITIILIPQSCIVINLFIFLLMLFTMHQILVNKISLPLRSKFMQFYCPFLVQVGHTLHPTSSRGTHIVLLYPLTKRNVTC